MRGDKPSFMKQTGLPDQARDLSLDLRPSLRGGSGLSAALRWCADRRARARAAAAACMGGFGMPECVLFAGGRLKTSSSPGPGPQLVTRIAVPAVEDVS